MNKTVEKINKRIKEEYFKSQNILIINDDILTQKRIKEKTIDLIIASPPYNLDINYGGYNDKEEYHEYLYFTKK